MKICRENPVQRMHCCDNVQAHAAAVFRYADISRLVSVCLFPLAAPTIGPVLAPHWTAYCAVRLSILSVVSPPARQPARCTRSSNLAPSFRTHAVYCSWVGQGLLRPPAPFTFTLFRSDARPTGLHLPQHKIFSIQRRLYEYI